MLIGKKESANWFCLGMYDEVLYKREEEMLRRDFSSFEQKLEKM